MKKYIGFSLIELMVVIAVVAILAAAAVPAYQSYVRTSKVMVALNAVKSLADSIMQYYDTKGVFPTDMSQVGYNSSTTNFPQTFPPTSEADYAAPPYFLGMQFNTSSSVVINGTCPNFSAYSFASNIDSSGAFTSSHLASYVIIENLYYNVNGVWTTLCGFYDISFSPNATYSTANTVPGCYNLYTTEGANMYSNGMTTLTNSC